MTAYHKLCGCREDVASLSEHKEGFYGRHKFSVVYLLNELVEVPLPLDVIVVARSPSFGNTSEAVGKFYVNESVPSTNTFPSCALDALWKFVVGIEVLYVTRLA